ncbi:MAG: phosphopantetheine-binding protein [Polyangiaceae bacterium]
MNGAARATLRRWMPGGDLEGFDVNADEVRLALKELMIAELNLTGKTPGDIDNDAPIFGAGLGLDSLDALQLAMAVEERFGVRVPEGEPARKIFASVNALVNHILTGERVAEKA